VLLRDSNSNASAFFPTEGPLEHDVRPVSVFQSAWGTLEPIDLDDRDLPNRNTLIVGQSGSSKSVLMQTLLADELHLERVLYTIIEKGESFATLVETLGDDAVRIPLDPERFSVNVMDLPERMLEPGADKISGVVNLVKAMVFESLEDHAAIKTAVLSAAVDQVYRRKLVSKRGEASELEKVFKGARLSDLRETLQPMDEMNGVAMLDLARACADELAIKLTDWTGDSPKGKFFDRETTIPFASKRVVLYDTSPLERYGEMKPVALMVLRRGIHGQLMARPERGQRRQRLRQGKHNQPGLERHRRRSQNSRPKLRVGADRFFAGTSGRNAERDSPLQRDLEVPGQDLIERRESAADGPQRKAVQLCRCDQWQRIRG
jgi:hypothetical protein